MNSNDPCCVYLARHAWLVGLPVDSWPDFCYILLLVLLYETFQAIFHIHVGSEVVHSCSFVLTSV